MSEFEIGFGRREDGRGGITIFGTPDALAAAVYRANGVASATDLTPWLLRLLCVNAVRAKIDGNAKNLKPVNVDNMAIRVSQRLEQLSDPSILDPDTNQVTLQIVEKTEYLPYPGCGITVGRMIYEETIGPVNKESITETQQLL